MASAILEKTSTVTLYLLVLCAHSMRKKLLLVCGWNHENSLFSVNHNLCVRVEFKCSKDALQCNEIFSGEFKKNQYDYVCREREWKRKQVWKSEWERLCANSSAAITTAQHPLVLFTYMWYAWIGSDVAQSKVLIMYFICDIIAVDLCTSTMYTHCVLTSIRWLLFVAAALVALLLHSLAHSV